MICILINPVYEGGAYSPAVQIYLHLGMTFQKGG